jgi:hypothetical protein
MTAVHAAEARALGAGHTAELPGEDELALLAHDARLAALIVVACGLAVAVSALPGRSGLHGWLGGVAAVLIANATLGRVVDGGSVLLAAGGLVLVTGAGVAVTGLVGVPRHSTQGPGADEQWSLLLPSVLAAGTLPVLVAQGMGSPRYVDWVPAELAASNLVAALALVVVAVAAAVLLARSAVEVALGVALPVAALVVLLEPSGASWQVRDAAWVMGVVLALASAPLVLAAAAGRSGSWRRRAVAGAVLLAAGGLLAVVPQLLVLPILAGGTLGLAVTMPAGAYVNYDGLPVIGGGLLIAVALLIPCLVLLGRAGRTTAPSELLGGTSQPIA